MAIMRRGRRWALKRTVCQRNNDPFLEIGVVIVFLRLFLTNCEQKLAKVIVLALKAWSEGAGIYIGFFHL